METNLATSNNGRGPKKTLYSNSPFTILANINFFGNALLPFFAAFFRNGDDGRLPIDMEKHITL